MVALQALVEEEQGSTSSDAKSLCLSNRELHDADFGQDLLLFPPTLTSLDLSRNYLKSVPSQILCVVNLVRLDVSRNSLRALPPEIKNLEQLEELHAISNQFRLRLLPLEELASLSRLRLLDLRFNSKLKKHALDILQEALGSSVEIKCTIPALPSNSNEEKKLSACDRDPTLLRSQLEPLSTPQLRKRLERTFGIFLEGEEAFDRTIVLDRLLSAYETAGMDPRKVREERGTLISEDTIKELIAEMEAIHWPHTTRERPKIKAEYYMILQKPGSGQVDSKRTRIETAKLNKYRSIFNAAVRALQQVDPDYANRFTALAVTKNFMGSPHIDTLNVGPFYGISLGDFGEGGGKIAVECSPTLVAEIDTRNRFAKVDGRFPHWVTPYEGGTRYSLIYYMTSGIVEPQTTAIFKLKDLAEDEWVPPPSFVL